MPAFVVNIPNLPKRFDKTDTVDPVDRNLLTMQAAAVLLQSMLYNIQVSPVTGTTNTAGTYPRPAYITSGGGKTSYEAAIDDAVTKIAAVVVDLQGIPALT